MMKLLAWFSALVGLVGVSVAWGCSSGSGEDPPPPPSGFTFQTADGSLSSIGWSGVFHDIKGDSGASFGAKVTNCDNGVCQFTGPIDPVDPVKRRRCLYRTSTLCTADSDCPLDQNNQPTKCVYLYDSPISTPLRGSDGKLGACALTYIPVLGVDQQPTIRGTLNLVSGELNIDELTVLLVLNAKANGTFQGVCPVCMGDTSPNDGVKDGTCHTGTVPDIATGHIDPGYPTDVKCDVNRYGELPGYNFGYSMDCSPMLTPNVGSPTPFGGAFSSSGFKVSIADDSPKCTDTNFKDANCFCGMCNDNTRAACRSSTECSDGVQCIGASIPEDPSNALNVPVASSSCDGGVCNWNETEGAGTCLSTRLGGKVGCYPSAINGRKDSMGNDVIISVPGRAEVNHGVYYADTASARCTPAGMNAAVNAQVGLPGLTFQKRNFRIIPEYPEGQK